jgi:hypothetical protein
VSSFNKPPYAGNWKLMVSKGDTGTAGTAGTNGKPVTGGVYTATGVLTAHTSPPLHIFRAGMITGLSLYLGTASTSGTVQMNIHKNGQSSILGYISAAQGAQGAYKDVAWPVVAGDYITVECSTPGTNAADAVVQVRIEES